MLLQAKTKDKRRLSSRLYSYVHTAQSSSRISQIETACVQNPEPVAI